MTTTMLTRRSSAIALRSRAPVELVAWRTASPAVRRSYALVGGTSVATGLANRRRMERARRARRVLRACALPLVACLALASGLAVGRMDGSAPRLRSIAPTHQPVERPVLAASAFPLALLPATHGAH